MKPPHVYVQSDVPEGMTLAEWRRRDASTRTERARVGVLLLGWLGTLLAVVRS